MTLLPDPFSTEFFSRALIGGALVAAICGIVGTWVVIRGMAFLGEAIGHGMLPGVALATVLGLPVLIGGAVSAVAMSAAIGALQRRGRLSYDTSIGLLFVAMLSLGVIIVSHSRSFATDATALLFSVTSSRSAQQTSPCSRWPSASPSGSRRPSIARSSRPRSTAASRRRWGFGRSARTSLSSAS